MAVKGHSRRRRTRSSRNSRGRNKPKGRVCGVRHRSYNRRQTGGTHTFQVRWPATGIEATEEGVEALQADVQATPELVIPGPVGTAQPQPLYTLIAWDPDAPAGPPSWLHWLVINIPAGATPSEGLVLTPWAPPTPPPGSGTHRYIFSLYQQPSSAAIAAAPVANRPHFNPPRFAETHGLRHLTNKRITVSASRVA